MENTPHTKPEPPMGKPEASDFGITYDDLSSKSMDQWGISGVLFTLAFYGIPAWIFIGLVGMSSPGFALVLTIGAVIFLITINARAFSSNLSDEKLKATGRYEEAKKHYDERFRRYKEKLRAYEKTRSDWWFSLSGRRFEIEFSDLLRARGYTTEVTQATGDGGVDIRAQKDGQKIIIECKAWKEKVGVTIVRQLNGVRAIDEIAWVVGLGGFTDPAIEFAKEKSIQLYEYKDIAEWVEIL
ncbi:restriction endonuclease [bacterium]|nr:restriction endonuclease [bacterium]